MEAIKITLANQAAITRLIKSTGSDGSYFDVASACSDAERDLAPEVLVVIMSMRSFESLTFPAVARIDGLVTPPPAPAAAAAATNTPPAEPVTP